MTPESMATLLESKSPRMPSGVMRSKDTNKADTDMAMHVSPPLRLFAIILFRRPDGRRLVAFAAHTWLQHQMSTRSGRLAQGGRACMWTCTAWDATKPRRVIRKTNACLHAASVPILRFRLPAPNRAMVKSFCVTAKANVAAAPLLSPFS